MEKAPKIPDYWSVIGHDDLMISVTDCVLKLDNTRQKVIIPENRILEE